MRPQNIQHIDISLPLVADYASWPGYSQPDIEVISGANETLNYRLTKLTLPTQAGTHIDAPSHYLDDGHHAESFPLDLFIGEVRVLDLSSLNGNVVSAKDCMRDGEWPVRVLLKTRASAAWREKRFPHDYPVLDEEAVDYLFTRGVRVVGTDAPSVDEFISKSPLVHRWLFNRGIYILESAYLYDVEEGYYELIALPLNIHGADGSPVRAILRTLA